MKLKDINPVQWASAGINKALNKVAPEDQTATQPATLPAIVPPTTVTPVDDQGKDAVPVSAQEANTALATINQREQGAQLAAIVTAAASKTEQFRKEAE